MQGITTIPKAEHGQDLKVVQAGMRSQRALRSTPVNHMRAESGMRLIRASTSRTSAISFTQKG